MAGMTEIGPEAYCLIANLMNASSPLEENL